MGRAAYAVKERIRDMAEKEFESGEAAKETG